MIDAEEAGGRGTSVVLSDLPASEHTESLHEDCPFNKIIWSLSHVWKSKAEITYLTY